MIKRVTLWGLLAAALLGLGLGAGCGPSTDLTGAPIPNVAPSTRITAQPPSLVETGFLVHFYWSGFDPDGRVVHYQWKISNNGTNGISVQDTLTFDPVTGDTLNPWFDTTATDSVFLVTADLPNFDDPQNGPQGTGFPRSFQTHTFWVRAVDDKGAVDPSPAQVSFTATTLLPQVRLTRFVSQSSYTDMPTQAVFYYNGIDPDFTTGIPTKVRYLWKPTTVRSRQEYTVNQIPSFSDSAWSAWIPYEADDDKRRIKIPDLTVSNTVYYLLTLQVMDTTGAVSIGRDYGFEVGNYRIAAGLRPSLTLSERYLGYWPSQTGLSGKYTCDIAAKQYLEFTWSADASSYGGEIVSYRYGWNVGDPTDPADPNWALAPGLSPQHKGYSGFAPTYEGQTGGTQRLVVQVVDNSNQITRFTFNLGVVPVPDPDDQWPLLLVDDVSDKTSNAWPAPDGTPLNRDEFRDEYWVNVLSGAGGVAGWNPAQDVRDFGETGAVIDYRTAVRYRSLLYTTANVANAAFTYIGTNFRPTFQSSSGDVDKYIWLIPYQEDVGNVLMAGVQVLYSYLATGGATYLWEMPIVFQSREGSGVGLTQLGTRTVRRSFGSKTLTDGTTYWVGPTRYPFQTAGVSVLDVMTSGDIEYNVTNGILNTRRRVNCVGMKGLAVDPQFKATHFPAGGVFADTIWTEPTLDWQDQNHNPAGQDILRYVNYIWGNDEFYNEVIVPRTTLFDIQQGEAWGCEGLCVEPMLRSIARFDWVRIKRLADDPTDTWPDGYYDDEVWNLPTICGPRALAVGNRSALTNNRVVGFVANKTAPNKPSQVGDVILGFDPYRFDHDQTRRMVRWILGEHFGLVMSGK